MKIKIPHKLPAFVHTPPAGVASARLLSGCGAAVLTAFALSSAGCGSGGGSARTTTTGAPSSVNTSPTTPQTRQTGVATITIPALPDAAADGRLIPDYASYIKVEFLDSDSGKTVPVPVPLYNQKGQQYPLTQGTTGTTEATSTPFDVLRIDRTAATQRSYWFLPLKNLVIRVSAYKSDPITDVSSNNPVVAFAEIPFLPAAVAPGAPAPNVSLTLQSAITSLEIMEITGANALHTGGASVGTYKVVAKSGSDVVLVNDADYAKFQWSSPEIVSGLSDNQKLPQFSFAPANAGDNASRQLIARGNQSGTVKLTVTDPDSNVVGTKLITLDALPGAVQTTVPLPPPGTHSFLVQIDDQVGGGVDNSGQDTLPNPIQIIQNIVINPTTKLPDSDATRNVNTVVKNAPVPAGVRRIWVRYYSGANATGVMLGDFIRHGEYFVPGTFASNAPTTINTSAEKVSPTPLVIKAVRGTYYTDGGKGFLSQITKPTLIADRTGPTSDFAFLGGTSDTLLEVAAQVPVSGTNTDTTAGFLETILDADVFTLRLPDGVISPSPSSNGSQTYQVVLPDFLSDKSVGLSVTENSNTPGLNSAAQLFNVSLQANKGGSIGSITIK